MFMTAWPANSGFILAALWPCSAYAVIKRARAWSTKTQKKGEQYYTSAHT